MQTEYFLKEDYALLFQMAFLLIKLFVKGDRLWEGL